MENGGFKEESERSRCSVVQVCDNRSASAGDKKDTTSVCNSLESEVKVHMLSIESVDPVAVRSCDDVLKRSSLNCSLLVSNWLLPTHMHHRQSSVSKVAAEVD